MIMYYRLSFLMLLYHIVIIIIDKKYYLLMFEEIPTFNRAYLIYLHSIDIYFYLIINKFSLSLFLNI